MEVVRMGKGTLKLGMLLPPGWELPPVLDAQPRQCLHTPLPTDLLPEAPDLRVAGPGGGDFHSGGGTPTWPLRGEKPLHLPSAC